MYVCTYVRTYVCMYVYMLLFFEWLCIIESKPDHSLSRVVADGRPIDPSTADKYRKFAVRLRCPAPAVGSCRGCASSSSRFLCSVLHCFAPIKRLSGKSQYSHS